MKTIIALLTLLLAATSQAQLSVTVSPVKITGQKAVVPLAFKNNLAEKIESARAVVFLFDEQGNAQGQPVTRWVIGGSADKPVLAAGATNIFHFVMTSDKPFVTTNLTAKVTFSRVVLDGGKIADVTKSVSVIPAEK